MNAVHCPESVMGPSFRDPAGYVFREDGIVKRLVTEYGLADYRRFMSSGLYEKLAAKQLLVTHEEQPGGDGQAILIPEQIPYISYPYEWSFSHFQDAALLTLEIQELAMQHGMSLKDASAFNVQFRGGRPVFIDTLSFEPNDGGPWVAYNQFCRHFVAPLLLSSQVSPALTPFWKSSLDGFPLDLTSALLPKRTYARPGVLMHVHLHARMQKKYEQPASGRPPKTIAIQPKSDGKPALVASLKALIRGLKMRFFQTEWLHYYDKKATHYSTRAEESKKIAVQVVLDRVRPRLMYDLGGNVGQYSLFATKRGIYSVCFDIDPLCVDANYRRARSEGNRFMLPLVLDLTNPSPGLGFALEERASLVDRGPADLLLALALLHHLRITGNVPMERIARFLAGLGGYLLLEYVPKADPMCQVLLQSRKDVFLDYTAEGFHAAFGKYFETEQTFPISDTDRVLYLFRRRP